MAQIVMDDVTKRYPDGFEAVKHIDLEVGDGEFIIFVLPSRCGTSNALRMIAGLDDIPDGELRISEAAVNKRSRKDRNSAIA